MMELWLGRAWKWADLIRRDAAQGKLFAPAIACDCMDEGDDE